MDLQTHPVCRPKCVSHLNQGRTNGQRTLLQGCYRKPHLRLRATSKREFDVRILAWCPVSHHILLAALPEADQPVAVLLRRVHGRHARRIMGGLHKAGRLIQGRIFSARTIARETGPSPPGKDEVRRAASVAPAR